MVWITSTVLTTRCLQLKPLEPSPNVFVKVRKVKHMKISLQNGGKLNILLVKTDATSASSKYRVYMDDKNLIKNGLNSKHKGWPWVKDASYTRRHFGKWILTMTRLGKYSGTVEMNIESNFVPMLNLCDFHIIYFLWGPIRSHAPHRPYACAYCTNVRPRCRGWDRHQHPVFLGMELEEHLNNQHTSSQSRIGNKLLKGFPLN